MPGATLTEPVDADTWNGELAVRLGPVGMRIAGELRFAESLKRHVLVASVGDS